MRISRPTPEISTVQVPRRSASSLQSWEIENVIIGFDANPITHASSNEAKFRLSLTADNISIASGSRAVVEIPTTSVLTISYQNETTNAATADAYWKFWDNTMRWTGDENYFAALALAPIAFGGSIIPELQKKKYHRVDLLYVSEEGKKQRVSFEVPTGHGKLLVALRSQTGVKWVDLSKTSEELRNGPEARLIREGRLVLDRDLQLESTVLPAGDYRIVLLPRDENRGNMYVYGRDKAVEPVARVEIEIDGLSRLTGEISATYSVRAGTNRIEELYLGGQKVRILAAP
jgi:hypothetical protein